MRNVRDMIKDIQWFKTSEGIYMGGQQVGCIYVLDLEGNRKQLSSVYLYGNGAIHRQTLDDLSDHEWSLLQAEYDKLMTVETTKGYALREYKPCKKKPIQRKKVYRLY
jgi:hypothetical protein